MENAIDLRESAERYRYGNGAERDPVKAADLYARAAAMGDASAASSLGYMLMVGEGIPVDKASAEARLRMAADAGDATAMCNLGVLLSESDPSGSVGWFERAADMGSLRAIKNLAASYSIGSGVPLDKRFVHYMMGSEGVCVTPLTGFHTDQNGFRLTLLQPDDAERARTLERIGKSIRAYTGL